MRWRAWMGYDFLFLTVGLQRISKNEGPEWVVQEPAGVGLSRRNIVVLSALIVLAGFACANPNDLNVFGLGLGTGARGTIVLSVAVFSVQAYWYGLKYLHIRDSGELDGPNTTQKGRALRTIRGACLKQKDANWIANCVAAGLTVASWGVLGYWLTEAFSSSTVS